MYRIKLNAKQCICCGICMDVCSPQVIAMRFHTLNRFQGENLTYVKLHSLNAPEQPPMEMMTFPYFIRPDQCDGCRLCVTECPVQAIELLCDSNSDRISSVMTRQENARIDYSGIE